MKAALCRILTVSFSRTLLYNIFNNVHEGVLLVYNDLQLLCLFKIRIALYIYLAHVYRAAMLCHYNSPERTELKTAHVSHT